MKDLTADTLVELLRGSGACVSFSQYCRSGIVGDLCHCWRCRGEKGPTDDEADAARDAKMIDEAKLWGVTVGRHAVALEIDDEARPTRIVATYHGDQDGEHH